MVDLFATRDNRLLDRVVSWRPDPSAIAVDTFFVPDEGREPLTTSPCHLHFSAAPRGPLSASDDNSSRRYLAGSMGEYTSIQLRHRSCFRIATSVSHKSAIACAFHRALWLTFVAVLSLGYKTTRLKVPPRPRHDPDDDGWGMPVKLHRIRLLSQIM